VIIVTAGAQEEAKLFPEMFPDGIQMPSEIPGLKLFLKFYPAGQNENMMLL